MNELKPCPFCGGVAEVLESDHSTTFYCWCDSCETRGNYYNTEAEAIEAWNTRAEQTCHIEYHYGEWYCHACGQMVGTCDTASILHIDGNAIELWGYCPMCGAKVVN